jgi:hypothetical protein
MEGSPHFDTNLPQILEINVICQITVISEISPFEPISLVHIL